MDAARGTTQAACKLGIFTSSTKNRGALHKGEHASPRRGCVTLDCPRSSGRTGAFGLIYRKFGPSTAELLRQWRLAGWLGTSSPALLLVDARSALSSPAGSQSAFAPDCRGQGAYAQWFAVSSGHAGGKQCTDQIRPRHPAGFGCFEPIQMVRDQARDFLEPATRKMEVFDDRSESNLNIPVTRHFLSPITAEIR